MILLIILLLSSLGLAGFFDNKAKKQTQRCILIRRDFERWHDYLLLLALFFLILIAGKIETMWKF